MKPSQRLAIHRIRQINGTTALGLIGLEDNGARDHYAFVLDLTAFKSLSLRGGFLIVEVRLTSQSLWDPLGRPAVAQTLIRGKQLHVLLRDGMADAESSVSLYHEILEAATLAAENPPQSVVEFNEGDFENSARLAHARYGTVSPESLNQMLARFGFEG